MGQKRSRFGCVNCKRQKKKCDEIKPICTLCLKTNKVCQYKNPNSDAKINKSLVNQRRNIIPGASLGQTVIAMLKENPELNDTIINKFDFSLEDDFLYEFIDKMTIPTELEIQLPVSLTDSEITYFEYYCKEILPGMCILPQEHNFYSKFYIPMAFKHEALLYSLIGWGCKMIKNIGVDYVVENEEADTYINKVISTIDINNTQAFLTNFCCYMTLVCMEVTLGDVDKWSQYFTTCFNIINRMPGDFNYLKSCSTELAENFAYFDVLASQTNENGTFYPISDYRQLLVTKNAPHDPLQGCLRPVIILIGEVVSLSVEYNSLKAGFDLPECDKYEVISDISYRADQLDKRIQTTRPEVLCVGYLNTPEDLEAHLSLYEAYQLSAQLYLRQVIKKLPPSSLEIEILYSQLEKVLEYLTKSGLKKSLGFPMLMVGSSACNKSDRIEVKQLFDNLIQACGYMCSYQKLWIVVQRLWELNSNGCLYVDWFKITKQFGWRLNLGR